MNKEIYLQDFGSRIKACRLTLGFSLEELANMIGYTTTNARSSLQKIESGKSDLPVSKLSLLSQTLGVTVDYLVNGNSTSSMPLAKPPINLERELTNTYGDTALPMLKLYSELSTVEQAEVRGEMKQMLKSH